MTRFQHPTLCQLCDLHGGRPLSGKSCVTLLIGTILFHVRYRSTSFNERVILS